MTSTQRLLILGAGIGGLSVIKEIAGISRRATSPGALDSLDITIVDEDFSHFLGFTLPWVMRGWRSADSIAIRPTEHALGRVRRITGRARLIDPRGRTVHLEDGTALGFDALVLATGSCNATEQVPGLAEAATRGIAVHYYETAAAAQAHRALREFSGGRLMFLVASTTYRCPVAPYEGAMLAADLLGETGALADTEICVYTPEIQPMPSAGPYAGWELVDLLRQRGISFHPEHQVVRVDADRGVVEFGNDAMTGFDLLVFVPPHQPALVIGEENWIGVDTDTMATRHPGIFAVGDTTTITTPWGRSLPKAATFARNGAVSAARGALHHLGLLNGLTDDTTALSGHGSCYLDTGAGISSLGAGDFFAEPHPAIHLSTPSPHLNRDKKNEEQAWRALWESTVPVFP